MTSLTGRRRISAHHILLALVGVTFVIGALIPLVVAPEQLLYLVTVDDAFYYHVLADNWLSGHGVVFNVGHPTNGFHPLYFLLVLSVQSVVDGLNPPVISMMAIGTVLHIAIAVNVFLTLREIRDRDTAFIGGVLWLLHPRILELSISGMETVLQVFFISILATYFVRQDWRVPSCRRLLIIGILLALIFLSRMDGVFIGLGIALSLLWRRSKSSNESLFSTRNVDLVAGASISTILVFPWLLWSTVATGHLFPVSGSAIRDTEIAFDRLARASANPRFGYFLEAYEAALMIAEEVLKFVTWGYFDSLIAYGPLGLGARNFDHLILYGIIAISISLLGMFLYFSRCSRVSGIREVDFLVIGIVLILSYYIFYGFRYRHYYSLSLLLVLVLIAGLSFGEVRDVFVSRLDYSAAYIVLPTVAILLALFLGVQATVITSVAGAEEQPTLYQEADYINKQLAEEAKPGNFNTGYAQYYTPNHDVENLDGVINTPAYEARRDGRIDCYILERNITHIVGFEGRPKRVFNNRDLAKGGVIELQKLDSAGILNAPQLAAYRIEGTNTSRC